MTNQDQPRWPGWIGLPIVKAKYFGSQTTIPCGIVIHSGHALPNVAEYISNPTTKNAKGDTVPNKVSYHIAWSDKVNDFVQCVSLKKRAYHAGVRGNDWIGIAFPGPWSENPREIKQLDGFDRAMKLLLYNMPMIKYWARHSDFQDGKKDPGPGFHDQWIERYGLKRQNP